MRQSIGKARTVSYPAANIAVVYVRRTNIGKEKEAASAFGGAGASFLVELEEKERKTGEGQTEKRY